MQFNLEVRLFNSETKEFHCFKHAVQSVMLEQSDFYMEVDDFTNHMTSPACVKCHPDWLDFDDCDYEDDEEREVRNEIHIDYFKKFPETVEEKTEEEIRTKGFAIKSKIKKGK